MRVYEYGNILGGIVFTPSPGLHEGFILLVDFVSLYPSIIEEFNVCFTTFELSDLNQVVLPKRHADIGLLPSLIRKLCAERNRIKKQLLIDNHDGKITVHQTALKLTMNSLYGYLAYNKSRFYAKHLAVYIAKKGREILTEAKNLVEAMGYEVIYGDTDSLMIKTNCETYQETVNLAEEIKVRINSLYKVIKLETQGKFKTVSMYLIIIMYCRDIQEHVGLEKEKICRSYHRERCQIEFGNEGYIQEQLA